MDYISSMIFILLISTFIIAHYSKSELFIIGSISIFDFV